MLDRAKYFELQILSVTQFCVCTPQRRAERSGNARLTHFCKSGLRFPFAEIHRTTSTYANPTLPCTNHTVPTYPAWPSTCTLVCVNILMTGTEGSHSSLQVQAQKTDENLAAMLWFSLVLETPAF